MQEHIRQSGTVILRADEDLPKLEAVISAWRAQIQKAQVAAALDRQLPMIVADFASEHVMDQNDILLLLSEAVARLRENWGV